MIGTFFKLIRIVLVFAWILFVILFGALLTVENPSSVEPSVFGIQFPVFSLGLYLLVVLVIGVLLGGVTIYLFVQKTLFARSREIRQFKKDVRVLEKMGMRSS